MTMYFASWSNVELSDKYQQKNCIYYNKHVTMMLLLLIQWALLILIWLINDIILMLLFLKLIFYYLTCLADSQLFEIMK